MPVYMCESETSREKRGQGQDFPYRSTSGLGALQEEAWIVSKACL